MYSDSTGKRLEVICLAMKDSQICMMIFFENHLQNIVDIKYAVYHFSKI